MEELMRKYLCFVCSKNEIIEIRKEIATKPIEVGITNRREDTIIYERRVSGGRLFKRRPDIAWEDNASGKTKPKKELSYGGTCYECLEKLVEQDALDDVDEKNGLYDD